MWGSGMGYDAEKRGVVTLFWILPLLVGKMHRFRP
jgi:hypothetical protein